jgi:predicted  nucleic acid-binding Zn-ribbon protein
MNIAEQLVLLAELANVDAKWKSVAERLESVPAAAKKAEELVASLKKQLEEASAKKTQAEVARKAIENEIADERNKIRKWEARANELKGEREHAALLSEINTAKRVIHRLEDTQLEHMEALEAAQKQAADLDGKIKKAQDTAVEEWKKVEGAVQALKDEQQELAGRRKALLDKLPPPLVKRYDQVAGKRQGVGVSLIKGEVCSMCKRTLPPQLCIQVRKGAVLEQCPSCSRFLVHESMTQAEQPTETVS